MVSRGIWTGKTKTLLTITDKNLSAFFVFRNLYSLENSLSPDQQTAHEICDFWNSKIDD